MGGRRHLPLRHQLSALLVARGRSIAAESPPPAALRPARHRWFVLHPDNCNKEGQLAWRWHPAELQEGQQQSARSGLAARGEKNRTFAASVCREGGPPASK